MERARVPFQKIVFVCINQREPHEACCSRRDSEAVAAALKTRVKQLGLSRMVRISKSGCQDLCAKGPNVMVFPDYAWYHGVTPDDVEPIIQQLLHDLPPLSAQPTDVSPRRV